MTSHPLTPEKVEVVAFMIADHAEAANGKLHMTGGGWDRLKVPDFPAIHPHLSLAVSLRLPWSLLNQEHEFEVKLLDEDNNPTGVGIGGKFESGRPAGFREGESMISHVVLNLNNLKIDKAGIYTFALSINGEHRADAPFKVLKVEPQTTTG